MRIKCVNYGRRVDGCTLYVDVPDISDADADRSPIPCELCWEHENKEARLRGADAFTDSWDVS